MKTILAFLLAAMSFASVAQTLTDQMGAIDCNYTIHSGQYSLDLVKQTLVERATAVARKSEIENESYGYAYAYTEWHLEFVSKNPIKSRKREADEDKSARQKYKLTFLNQAGDELLTTYIGQDKLQLWKGKSAGSVIYTYSLNFVNIPLVLLDNVSAINIILVTW